MTHFPTIVLLPAVVPAEELHAALDLALAPFDEHLAAPCKLLYTRAELVARERSRLVQYRDSTYAEYVADPEAYRARYPRANDAHYRYIEDEFPRLLALDDAGLWEREAKRFDEEMVDDEGNVYSTCNPDGHWDWWAVGGRWPGWFQLRSGASAGPQLADPDDRPEDPARADCARLRDVVAEEIPVPTAHVGLDGVWRKACEVGWFGSSWDDDPGYEERFRGALALAPGGTWLVNVDCHI